ncbi:MAG: M48 family metallopeptidase [Desulfovibrio sp.]|nr:M48 family metallopeptidase [Desulfovibrio sp.]
MKVCPSGLKTGCLAFCVCGLLLCGGCLSVSQAQKGLAAGSDLFKAATLNDNDLRAVSAKFRASEDQKNRVAAPDSAYARRLARITEKLTSVNGVPLSYKVYLTKEVNANAAPDGSVRVYSGLMDSMNDDELRFVIGHEIGHVALGHSKKAMQMAYATSAARNAVGAVSAQAGMISDSQIGVLGEKFINSQFSQSQESDADAYSMKFLKDNGYNTKAAGDALRKLANGGRSGLMEAMFSSHPDSLKRAEKMDALAASN